MSYFKRGFTALEILVVIAIMVLLVAVVVPSFATMRNNQVLKTTVLSIVSGLDKARSQSLSSVSSSEYGVHFETNKIVIFTGMTYSSGAPTNEDIEVSFPASISSINLTGGATELYFDRLSGAPNKTGTITVLGTSSSKIITISTTGTVSTN